jgi:hypothetical protein
VLAFVVGTTSGREALSIAVGTDVQLSWRAFAAFYLLFFVFLTVAYVVFSLSALRSRSLRRTAIAVFTFSGLVYGWVWAIWLFAI